MKKTITLLLLSLVPGLLCAQPPFENITNLAGVANLGERNRGSCLIDFDNDGDVDLYTYTRNSYHHLFENNGAGQFTDITEELGLHQSYQSRVVTWGDLNNDGWLDLYIGNFNSPDVIYLNNGPDNQGQFSFSDVTANSGISQNNFEDPKAVLMADYDQDGDLDIYLSNFNDQNRLYRNNGDLTFTDVVYEAGVTDIQMSMSAIFFDYDNDHDVDLYLVHDFDIPNILYRNDGNGQFTDVSAEAGVDYAGDGMGVDAADINRDGFLDLYVSNLYENVLFLNNGDGTFTDISQSAGVDDYGMAWGTFFLDYNNDGWSDIYVINDSHFSDFPNVLYTNLQDNTFQISGGSSVVADEGAGFGGGIGDINGDGKLDILIANTDPDEGNVLLQNNTFDRNWIGFHLRGNRSNRFAVGAKVHIFYNQQQQLDEIHAGTGFASQNEYRLHFGLHQATLVDSVRIIWPNGQQQMLYELPVNQNYTIEEMNFPIIQSVVANDTVVLAHDKFELEVELEASFDNPFDYEQVHLRAEFTAPGGQTYLVDGFYMQDYQLQTTNGQLIPEGEGAFKLRFTPTIPGEWTYRLSVQDSIGMAFSQIGHFACSSNASRGFVRSSSSNYLKFENGEAFIPIGENIAWPNGNPYTNYKAWLSKLAENNGNFFRIWDAHWGLGLEWNAAYPGYSGLKQYQQENARYLDWLVEYCREQDLYLMFCLQHHGQMSNSVNPNWSGNPYNMANGGMCESPTDFFAQAKAKKTLQNKWRYCLARWGYSPQLMAWELFNEVDWTDDFQNIQNIIQDWHLEMAAWIKENDPHKHLVTTSFANPAYDPQIWNQPDIDFTQTHFYLNIPNLEQVLVDGVRDYLADYQKPTLTGEFGLGSNLNLANIDPDGIHFHNALWGSLFGGGMGSAMSWWWDNYIHPRNLYYHFAGLAAFAEQLPFLSENLQPATVQVSGAPADLQLLPSLGWAGIGDSFISIDSLGQLQPQNPDLALYLYGNEWNTAYRNPPTFAVNFPDAGQFRVTTNETTGTSPKIAIFLDGNLVLQQSAFPNQMYTIDVPAGPHEIFVDNTGVDWISIKTYEFERLGTAVSAYVLKGENADYAAGWCLQRDYNHQFLNENGEPSAIDSANLILNNMQAGQYTISWFDPLNGDLISSENLVIEEEELILPIPELWWDLAFTLQLSNSTFVEIQPALKAQISPNPVMAGGEVLIELPQNSRQSIRSLQLLNAEGRLIQEMTLEENNEFFRREADRLSFQINTNLAAGNYWLRIRANNQSITQPLIIINP